MVTDALDHPADRHLDRIVDEVLAERDWERAALKLLVAADYGDVLTRWAA